MESTEVRKELTLADVVKGKLDAEGVGEFRREFGGPDEVQVNTPLRPSPVRPLRREELKRVLGVSRE